MAKAKEAAQAVVAVIIGAAEQDTYLRPILTAEGAVAAAYDALATWFVEDLMVRADGKYDAARSAIGKGVQAFFERLYEAGELDADVDTEKEAKRVLTALGRRLKDRGIGSAKSQRRSEAQKRAKGVTVKRNTRSGSFAELMTDGLTLLDAAVAKVATAEGKRPNVSVKQVTRLDGIVKALKGYVSEQKPKTARKASGE